MRGVQCGVEGGQLIGDTASVLRAVRSQIGQHIERRILAGEHAVQQLGQRGKVTVPPVTGLSVRDAIDLLTENGLKYEIKRVYSDTDEKDRVVRQSEAANSKVAKDTIVTLEVSDGPAPTEAPTEAPTTAPTEPEPTTESSESGD